MLDVEDIRRKMTRAMELLDVELKRIDDEMYILYDFDDEHAIEQHPLFKAHQAICTAGSRIRRQIGKLKP